MNKKQTMKKQQKMNSNVDARSQGELVRATWVPAEHVDAYSLCILSQSAHNAWQQRLRGTRSCPTTKPHETMSDYQES